MMEMVWPVRDNAMKFPKESIFQENVPNFSVLKDLANNVVEALF